MMLLVVPAGTGYTSRLGSTTDIAGLKPATSTTLFRHKKGGQRVLPSLLFVSAISAGVRYRRLVPSIANSSIASISALVSAGPPRAPTLFSSCATLDAPMSAEVTCG